MMDLEDFLSELVTQHFRRQQWQAKPRFSDAYWSGGPIITTDAVGSREVVDDGVNRLFSGD